MEDPMMSSKVTLGKLLALTPCKVNLRIFRDAHSAFLVESMCLRTLLVAKGESGES